jgi:hypothetical protein
MLHHLASHDNSVAGLPLFKGLMTATLDSLHQRLLNECEETLNHIVKTNDPVFPTDPLQCIMFDLRKLTDMIKYDDEYQKKSLVEVEAIEKMVQQGNETNGHLQEIIILVKEIVRLYI